MSSFTKKAANRKKSDVARALYGLHISRTIRQEWSTTGYDKIVRSILGDTYTLSLVLIGDTRARALSTTYRNKSHKLKRTYLPHNHEAGGGVS